MDRIDGISTKKSKDGWISMKEEKDGENGWY